MRCAALTRPPRRCGLPSARRPLRPRNCLARHSLNVVSPTSTEERPGPGGAIFLSYAREDTAAAQRIADTLRAGGVEVWFDLTGLVGGDVWDAKIRRQIRECTLFMPIISASTQARAEGYFRLEWRLADQRTHLMGKSRAFLVPVCIDETRETDADAPDSFLAVQWTRLPGGATPPAFCERVQRLLAGTAIAPESASKPRGEAGAAGSALGVPSAGAARQSFRIGRFAVGAVAAVLLVAAAWWLFGRKPAGSADSIAAVSPAHPPPASATLAQEPTVKSSEAARGTRAPQVGRQENSAGAQRPGAIPAPTVEVTPASADAAAKAIAVLAFENISGDKDNEPFCDGISDELLNLLGKVPGLVVKGRTSAFSFKGQRLDDTEIGRKLGVRYVVNGSIQKVGTRVRITPRLVQAADGVVVWSDKFTEELKDIFALQDRIAGLIAQALQVKLGAALRTAQTVDPEAHRLALEGRHYASLRTPDGFARAETALTQAITRDPDFAPAHAALAEVCVMRANYAAQDGASGSEVAADVQRARLEAQRAIALDPANPDAYAALGYCDFMEARYAEAERQYQRAIELSPNQSIFFAWRAILRLGQGRLDLGVQDLERTVALDPLWPVSLANCAEALMSAGRLSESLQLAERALNMRHGVYAPALGVRARVLFVLGRTDEAVATARLLRTQLRQNPRRGADEAAIWVLQRAGLGPEAAAYAEDYFKTLPPASQQRGFALGGLGRFDEALPFLERMPASVRRRLYWDPIWDPWREDPRFRQLITKLDCVAEYEVARKVLAQIRPQPDARSK